MQKHLVGRRKTRNFPECKASYIVASGNAVQHEVVAEHTATTWCTCSRTYDLCTCDGRARRANGDISRNDSFLEPIRKGIPASRPPRNLLYVPHRSPIRCRNLPWLRHELPRNFFHPSIIILYTASKIRDFNVEIINFPSNNIFFETRSIYEPVNFYLVY